ncbi:DUF2812 domain-containing protein [Anaerotignum sp.]
MKEKKIRRWKSSTTKLQGEAYLREMAEQGLILEDMGYYQFIFREGEPQYLQYRMEERKNILTEEEREAYAREGWQEVCHYELEYIFVRERDPFAEDAAANAAEIAAELDEKIALEKKNERTNRYGQLAAIGIGLIAVFSISGFSGRALYLAIQFLVRFLPWILLAFVLSRRRTKKLQREKEEVLNGNISDDYTDWRKGRRATFILITMLVVGLGVWVYYASDFNEKTFDLPQEISYEEIPAVRLEMLTEEKLVRAGESIDPSKEGIRMNAAFWEGNMYDIQKEMGGFENYGIDYRYLLKTEEKVETKQCMQTEDGMELNLDTMYYRFRSERDAVMQYNDRLEREEEMADVWKEIGVPPSEIVSMESGVFDVLHICRTGELIYHIICRQGKQVMEVKYSGNTEIEAILKEIDAVFTAQEE